MYNDCCDNKQEICDGPPPTPTPFPSPPMENVELVDGEITKVFWIMMYDKYDDWSKVPIRATCGPQPTPHPNNESCFKCHPVIHYPDKDCYSCHPDG